MNKNVYFSHEESMCRVGTSTGLPRSLISLSVLGVICFYRLCVIDEIINQNRVDSKLEIKITNQCQENNQNFIFQDKYVMINLEKMLSTRLNQNV